MILRPSHASIGIRTMSFDPTSTPLPAPPALLPMAHIRCEVGALVSLGAGPWGERRYVPLGGGSVRGPELNGTIVEGGVDWQVARGDGVLDIAAHYVVRTPDGGLVEVQSDGMRHGPPDVLARLFTPFFITVGLVEAAYFINLAFMALFVFATPVGG